MGLFDKMKKTADDAKQRMGEAKSRFDDAKTQLEQAKAHIETAQFSAKQAVGAATGKSDVRPFPPQELLAHQQNECVKVSGTSYHQDTLSRLPGNHAMVSIGKAKMKDWDSYPVTMLNGDMLGAIYDDGLKKAGIKPGSTAIAEIYHPMYRFDEGIELYIQRTPEAIAEQEAREAMKLWTTLDATKWEIEQAERFKFLGGEILTRQVEGKKPVYIVMGENRKLFEVNSRMKMYKDIEQRAHYPIRKLIAELKEGEHGQYYRVGFYY